MFVVAVHFVVKTESAAAFLARVRQQANDSLTKEPDCHLFDVCIDPARPERVFLYERYTNAAAFDAHLASDHFKAFDHEVADLVLSKTVGKWVMATCSTM